MRVALGTSTPTSMTVVATSSWISPSLKRRMVRSLAGAGMRPCTMATLSSGRAAASAAAVSSAAWIRHLLGFVDERADPICLPSCEAGSADAHDDFVAPRLGERHGVHRRAARRQLVDDRDVEVGVRRHRERARYRRRGHDQLVRLMAVARALLAQRQALMHAEAVLLVDDHERERGELDALLEQRVRADDERRATRGGYARARRCAPCPSAARSRARRRCRAARTSGGNSARADRRAARSAPSARPADPPRWRGSPQGPRRASCRSRHRLAPAAASAWRASRSDSISLEHALLGRRRPKRQRGEEPAFERAGGWQRPARILLNAPSQQFQGQAGAPAAPRMRAAAAPDGVGRAAARPAHRPAADARTASASRRLGSCESREQRRGQPVREVLRRRSDRAPVRTS